MRPTIVILVVGLSPRHIGPDTPHIRALSRGGAMRPLSAVTPAVTCPAQATFITGGLPRDHGIVANGWLFRDLMIAHCEGFGLVGVEQLAVAFTAHSQQTGLA